MEDKKPTYKELNGATRVGDALRWLGKQGKTFAPELLNLAGTVTGIQGLNKLGDAIRKDESLSDVDKDLLLQEMEYDMESSAGAFRYIVGQRPRNWPHTFSFSGLRPISFLLSFSL